MASVFIVLQKKDRQLIDENSKFRIIYGVSFSVIGVFFLKLLPEELKLHILSAFLIALSLLSILGMQYSIPIKPRTFRIAGACLCFLTGSVSISGPPIAFFLNTVKVDYQEFREVFSWFSIVTATVALVGYGVLGMLTFSIFKTALLFFPLLFMGSFIGKRWYQLIPSLVFQKALLINNLISSVLILIK